MPSDYDTYATLEMDKEGKEGSMVGKLMFDKHIFPQQLCGISSGHLWTQCITWGTMGSGGMVQ